MPFHERNAKNRCADRGVLRIPTVRFGSDPASELPARPVTTHLGERQHVLVPP